MLVGMAVIGERDAGEETPADVEIGTDFFQWPGVTGSGGLQIVDMGSGTVVFNAVPTDESKWTFLHWMGPGGVLYNESEKTFTVSEASDWTAVFAEVA